MIRLARRPGGGRAPGRVAVLAAGVTCALLLGVTGWRDPPPSSLVTGRPVTTPAPSSGGEQPLGSRYRASTYTVVQMNLCLSGVADCFAAAAYPAGVGEAVARVRETGADAVTVNEACRSDAARIARRTGYHLRFAPVDYDGGPFPCVDPGGRGLFGHALLTRAPIVGSESEAFAAQADLEERRWLCVTTRDGVDVCTAHLETPHSEAAADANGGQCAELAGILAARPSRAVVFGGDVNRHDSCAPEGAWSRTDASSHQAPGVQHVYGSSALGSPVAEVVPSAFTDHDLLLVRAWLAPG